MVRVQFLRTGDRPLRTDGPFPWVRLHATALQAGPDGREIARYHGGVWASGDVAAPKFLLHGSACSLRFEGESAGDSATFGRFDQVEVVDGAVYATPRRRLLSRLDEGRGPWYTYQDKRFWPSLVVEKCDGSTGP
jgi:hypothetical protein